MKKRIAISGILIIILALLIPGCTKFLKRELEDKKAPQIWKQVREKTGSLYDFYAKSELRIESGFRIIQVNSKIYYRSPDWITFRVFGPMNLKILEASIQKNRFQIYSLISNEYFTGNLDSVKISTRFKISLPDIDLRVAWQRLFNPQPPDQRLIQVRKSGKYYIMEYSSPKGIHEIWVDGKKMLISRENMLNQDRLLIYYIAYDEYKKKDGIRFPRRIEMGDIDQGVKLTFECTKFKVNQDITDADMMLSVPPEAKRIELKDNFKLKTGD